MSAVVVAIITFVGNYYVGRLKSTVDARALATNANDAVRDDLIQMIDRYEKREQYLIDRIDKTEVLHEELQGTIRKLREEINALRLENQGLKAELQQTRQELEKFERKVYYIPNKEGKE
jgi:chromosome segregation ATPase